MKPLILTAVLLCASQTYAQQLTLRCTLTYLKDGSKSDSWIVIDQAANLMRVDGVARQLIMTNDRYSSTQPSGPFTRISSIDRNTGEISVVSLYEGKEVLPSRGVCEKAVPPATAKF